MDLTALLRQAVPSAEGEGRDGCRIKVAGRGRDSTLGWRRGTDADAAGRRTVLV